MDKELLFTILFCILLTIFTVAGVLWLDNKQCLTAYSNYEPQWGVFSRCRIMIEGKLTPTDIVRELK